MVNYSRIGSALAQLPADRQRHVLVGAEVVRVLGESSGILMLCLLLALVFSISSFVKWGQ